MVIELFYFTIICNYIERKYKYATVYVVSPSFCTSYIIYSEPFPQNLSSIPFATHSSTCSLGLRQFFLSLLFAIQLQWPCRANKHDPLAEWVTPPTPTTSPKKRRKRQGFFLFLSKFKAKNANFFSSIEAPQ